MFTYQSTQKFGMNPVKCTSSKDAPLVGKFSRSEPTLRKSAIKSQITVEDVESEEEADVETIRNMGKTRRQTAGDSVIEEIIPNTTYSFSPGIREVITRPFGFSPPSNSQAANHSKTPKKENDYTTVRLSQARSTPYATTQISKDELYPFSYFTFSDENKSPIYLLAMMSCPVNALSELCIEEVNQYLIKELQQKRKFDLSRDDKFNYLRDEYWEHPEKKYYIQGLTILFAIVYDTVTEKRNDEVGRNIATMFYDAFAPQDQSCTMLQVMEKDIVPKLRKEGTLGTELSYLKCLSYLTGNKHRKLW